MKYRIGKKQNRVILTDDGQREVAIFHEDYAHLSATVCAHLNNPLQSDHESEKLYQWLIDENRPPALTAFTSGWTRTVAAEIEMRLHMLSKKNK